MLCILSLKLLLWHQQQRLNCYLVKLNVTGILCAQTLQVFFPPGIRNPRISKDKSPLSYPLKKPNLIVFEICNILSRTTNRPLNTNVTLLRTVKWILNQYSVLLMKWKSTSSLFTSMGNDLLISHRLALRDLLVITNDQIFKQLFFSLRTDFSLIILF